MREAANARGTEQDVDGFLVRAHPAVHDSAMTHATRDEHMRVHSCGVDRPHVLRETSVMPAQRRCRKLVHQL